MNSMTYHTRYLTIIILTTFNSVCEGSLPLLIDREKKARGYYMAELEFKSHHVTFYNIYVDFKPTEMTDWGDLLSINGQMVFQGSSFLEKAPTTNY